MKKVVISMLLVSATLLASESGTVKYKSGVLLPPQGDTIYKDECAKCHGENGKQTSFGGYPDVIEYGKIAGLNALTLSKMIKEYRGGVESKDYQPLNKYGYGAAMVTATRDLSWDEIDAVAKYISNLK